MKIPRLQPGDVIEIVWVDIVGNAAWTRPQELDGLKPACCCWCGYFVSKDKDCLRGCNTVSFGDGDTDYYIFPLGVIKSLAVLKRSENGSGSNL